VILTSSAENELARHLSKLVGQSTFPMESPTSGAVSTAFLFNDLLSSTDVHETVATWILTIDAATYMEVGAVRIRPEMVAPSGSSADGVILTNFSRLWYHFPDIGVASMPMAVLNDYAARNGWAWHTEEVTDGLAANARDIAALGNAPHTILVLGTLPLITVGRSAWRLSVARCVMVY
jgi:hypothetical protein